MSNMFSTKYPFSHAGAIMIAASTPFLLRDVFSKSSMLSRPSKYHFCYAAWLISNWHQMRLRGRFGSRAQTQLNSHCPGINLKNFRNRLAHMLRGKWSDH